MSRRPDFISKDPLGEALHALRMSGTFYCRSELTAPWALTMPPMEGCLWFHAVTSGSMTLEGRGVPATTLSTGDFALVPHGRGHVLRSTTGRAAAPDVTTLPHEELSERYVILRHGQGGPLTTLVCGVVRFDHPAANDLTDLLPAVLHLDPGALGPAEWMESTLRLMAAEAKSQQPGGETVITRLADVLVIQAIRRWLATDESANRGRLGALRDAQIGHALAMVHREPSREWSVASLAKQVAMSRSAFAAKFNHLVGEPPMRYLARQRVLSATTLLGEGGRTVAEVANHLGYQSEAAFSRAFKRVLGTAPGSYKKRAA